MATWDLIDREDSVSACSKNTYLAANNRARESVMTCSRSTLRERRRSSLVTESIEELSLSTVSCFSARTWTWFCRTPCASQAEARLNCSCCASEIQSRVDCEREPAPDPETEAEPEQSKDISEAAFITLTIQYKYYRNLK